jgi:hypothetical protein
MELVMRNAFDQLRINDLIAKVAHVRAKDTIRVLLALQAVAEEYDLSLEELVQQPHSVERPTPLQAKECDRAYWWMYENKRLNRYLYEIEQFD